MRPPPCVIRVKNKVNLGANLSTLEAHIQLLPKNRSSTVGLSLAQPSSRSQKSEKGLAAVISSAQDLRVNIEKTAFDHMKREKKLERFAKI